MSKEKDGGGSLLAGFIWTLLWTLAVFAAGNRSGVFYGEQSVIKQGVENGLIRYQCDPTTGKTAAYWQVQKDGVVGGVEVK